MGETDLKGIETKHNYNVKALETAIYRIFSGGSILFLGAGFSIGSENKDGEEPPLAGDLSEQICALGDFEVDRDLAYSADYFLRYNDPHNLIGFLQNKFSICKVNNHHAVLSSLPWRRAYTTNYDNCFEMAATESSRVITPLSLLDSPRKYFKNSEVCVHINGAIQQLDESTLEYSFKLTESSYTNSDSFQDSSWAYRFRKDLENCTQIVFVGYSLADMEIRRLLINADYLKEKTVFITQTNPTTKSHHRLSRYGEVFPVGVEAFAELVEERRPHEPTVDLGYLAAIRKLTLKTDIEYGDNDIRDFLLRGKAGFNYHASALTSPGSIYSIQRHQTQPAIAMLEKTPAILIHSTVANGKSVLALQIAAQLVIESRDVYTLIDQEGDYEGDAERLAAKSGGTIYLVIDSCEKSLDAVRYFSETLGDWCRFILTERPHRYRRVQDSLDSWGIKAYTLNVDYLQEKEISQLSSILQHAGLWGKRDMLSEERKIRYLTVDCESQLSVVLLDILESEHVKKAFVDAFSGVLKHPDTKKAVYVICVLQEVYGGMVDKSLIATLADSNHVYSPEFDGRVLESSLFEFKKYRPVTTSAIFGQFMLRNLFDGSYSVDQLISVYMVIEKHFDTISYEEQEIRRRIMTFGTLSKILPVENRQNLYPMFYDKLKRQVPRVEGNPHYWLQYAMGVMSTHNLADAERLLNTAYSKAERIDNYDTTYIDNQFARLNLSKAIEEKDPNSSFDLFLRGHNILKNEEDDIFKFRQAGLYIPYFEQRHGDLSNKNQAKFERAVKEMLDSYRNFLDLEYALEGVPLYQEERIQEFEKMSNELRVKNKG